jgi:hypothetical protein
MVASQPITFHRTAVVSRFIYDEYLNFIQRPISATEVDTALNRDAESGT